MLSSDFVGYPDTRPDKLRQGVAMTDTLGDRLRDLRKGRKLPQIEVAEAVGISRSYLAGIETGGENAGRETLVALADFYGVTIDELYRGTAPTGPEAPELVEDPDERALLAFWRGLDQSQKKLLLRLLASQLDGGA